MRILPALVLPALLAGSIISTPNAFARTAADLTAGVAVTPATISYNSSAYVSVATVPGAKCKSNVTYNNGSQPTNWQNAYKDKWYIAGRNGVVIWPWNFKARHLSSGKATVTCTYKGATVIGTAVFKLQ